MDHERLVVLFNAGECIFWIALGMIVFRRNRRESSKRIRKISVFATGAFVFFGISDLVECFSGAWWEPPWLFVLKVLCVLALVGCFYFYRKEKSRDKATALR